MKTIIQGGNDKNMVYNVEPVENNLTSRVHAYKNSETFKLIGEGVYHYEQKSIMMLLRLLILY